MHHVHTASSVNGSAFKRYFDERNRLLVLSRHGSPADAARAAGRSLLVTAAYAHQVTANPWSIRPFLEVQYHHVGADQGPTVQQLFGSPSFWALTFGVRLLAGGDPMRMGSYGVLDPMTEMSRTGAAHVH